MLLPLFTFLLACSVAYLLLGWYGREHLLQHNPCNMTYTTMAKTTVRVNSTIVGPRLYKHPSSAEDKGHLNPQPVLFIPGNRGT